MYSPTIRFMQQKIISLCKTQVTVVTSHTADLCIKYCHEHGEVSNWMCGAAALPAGVKPQ